MGTHCFKFHLPEIEEHLQKNALSKVTLKGSFMHKGVKGLADRRLFQWLVGDAQPFNIADSLLFREFCATFQYKPMSRPTMAKWLVVAHSDAEEFIFVEMQEQVSAHDRFCIPL